jgi:hypothetical protein
VQSLYADGGFWAPLSWAQAQARRETIPPRLLPSLPSEKEPYIFFMRSWASSCSSSGWRPSDETAGSSGGSHCWPPSGISSTTSRGVPSVQQGAEPQDVCFLE